MPPETKRGFCSPRGWCLALSFGLLVAGNGSAWAQEPAASAVDPRLMPPGFNAADTAWMLVASALVLMMTAPGLALFYCGLVRKKNVLSVMMQCVFLMGMMSLVWAGWGYSLAFGSDVAGGFVGGVDYLFLRGVLPSQDPQTGIITVPMEMTLPKSLHMIYQMMFFIITPALICGAYAERMKFSAMVVFSVLWGTFVYCPIAHWVWSANGWLNFLNAKAACPSFDFAGGTVVHISSGVSALVCCLMLGRRLGYGQEPMVPHNLTYTCIGAAMLWVGWFGFNAGSALGATAQAVNAFVATHLAAAAGTVAWAGMEWLLRGKASILGSCSGAVAGLVCITPGCGMVTPLAGILFGLVAGVVCYQACNLKTKLGYDDSLDAFGVHGVGGILGALLTGVFATVLVIPGATGGQGLLEGKPVQLLNQTIGVIAAMALAIVGSVILLKILDLAMGLRVTQQQELQGLDVSQHGEEGYIFL
jgi:Amt family ammonium transporter